MGKNNVILKPRKIKSEQLQQHWAWPIQQYGMFKKINSQ